MLFHLLPLLFACQEPFGVARTDLAGTRIVGMSQAPTDEGRRLSAWVLDDGRPYSDVAGSFEWYALERGTQDALEEALEGASDHVGPAPTVDRQTRAWGLRFTSSTGIERLGLLTVGGDVAPPRVDLSVERILNRTTDTLRASDRATSARQDWDTAPINETVSPRDLLRVTALDTDRDVRWVADGAQLPLSPQQVDWTATPLAFDDEELTLGAPSSTTWMRLLGVALDDDGATSLVGWDQPLDDQADPYVRLQGRAFPIDQSDLTATVFSGTVVLDDEAPNGIRLEEISLFDLEGTSACGSVLTADLLLSHQCDRERLEGQRVRLEGAVW